MTISSLLGPCAHKSFLESCNPLNLVEAPLFIWLAVVVILALTLAVLLWLVYSIHRERRLHQKITRGLRAIRSEYSSDMRYGLPQAAYEAVGQLFQSTPLGFLWDSFDAQLIVRRDARGNDRFWTSASAESVFNEGSVLEPRLNRNFYTAIPGIVTGFGLLCTFVAILFALLGVHLADNRFAGLDKLVSGLSGKFLTSIAALLAATIFLLCEKPLLHSLTRSLRDLVGALDAILPRLTESRLLDEIRSYMEEQSTAFKHFSSDLSTKLKQGVEEGMGPTRERLVGAVEELNQLLRASEAKRSDALTGSLDRLLQNLSHSLTSALASMSERFTQTLSGSANQEFDRVVSTMGGTAELLKNMNAQFQASQTMLTELVSLARNTTVEQMALGKTQVEELTTVLHRLMVQMQEASDTSMNRITTTLATVVQDLSTQVTGLGQQMSQTVTASAGEATGAARAVIERADQWSSQSAQQLAELLKKHHSQLDRVEDVQSTLDATLTQFKGILSEYTTVTMNLSQIAKQTSGIVAGAAGSTKAMQEASEAIEHVAELTASQVESFKVITGSMQRYDEVFRRVEEAAGKLLLQIDQHLRNYQETTQEGFDKLTSTANGFITDATNKLGMTVNELDEHLQDLTEILGRFRK